LTKIGYYAFADCQSLKAINIPSSVTSIAEGAFSGCSSTESIVLPEGITNISDRMFSGCTSLTNIHIPASVTNIVSGAFAYCKNLASFTVDDGNKSYSTIDGVLVKVYYSYNSSNAICENLELVVYPQGKDGDTYTIPDGIQYIGDGAFFGNEKLTRVSMPNSVTRIGDAAFRECTAITGFDFSTKLSYIYDRAFQGCSSLQSAALTGEFTSVRWNLFKDCTSLKSVSLPSSVTVIESEAFSGCTSLTEFQIPAKCKQVESLVFHKCTALQSISVEDGNEYYVAMDDALFSRDRKTLVAYPAAKEGSYEIPDGVTSTGEYAFDSSKLSSIKIPQSVTTLGGWTFAYCENIKSIQLPDNLGSMSYGLFIYCNSLTGIEVPATASSYERAVFYGCSNLRSILLHTATPLNVNQSWIFDGVPTDEVVVYIPKGSKADYESSTWGKFFDHFVEYDDNGLLDIPQTKAVAQPGETFTISATFIPGLAQIRARLSSVNSVNGKLRWTCSDEEIATLTPDAYDDCLCEVTVNKLGRADITVETTDGTNLSGTCQLIAGEDGLQSIVLDTNETADIYNLAGVLILKNATQGDIRNLPNGIYIANRRKFVVK
jgi:hypothetical protein